MKTFTLPQLAAELDMSPKTMRAILRKKGYKRPGTRWVWSTDRKAEIKAVVRGKTFVPPARRPRKGSTELRVH